VVKTILPGGSAAGNAGLLQRVQQGEVDAAAPLTWPHRQAILSFLRQQLLSTPMIP
jgi:hypothetical protein